MNQLENVKIVFSKFNCDFPFCPNLKRLQLSRDVLKCDNGFKWLHKNYPKLKNVFLYGNDNDRWVEYIFKIESKSLSFWSYDNFLKKHRDFFCGPTIVFRELFILIQNSHERDLYLNCFEYTKKNINTLHSHGRFVRRNWNEIFLQILILKHSEDLLLLLFEWMRFNFLEMC